MKLGSEIEVLFGFSYFCILASRLKKRSGIGKAPNNLGTNSAYIIVRC